MLDNQLDSEYRTCCTLFSRGKGVLFNSHVYYILYFHLSPNYILTATSGVATVRGIQPIG